MASKFDLFFLLWLVLLTFSVKPNAEIQIQVVTEPQFLTVDTLHMKSKGKPKHRLEGAITKFVRRLLRESESTYALSILPWKRAINYVKTRKTP